MPLTIDSTPGGAAANSYVASVADADTIVSGILTPLVSIGVPVAAWNAAGSDAKTTALIFAAQRVDSLGPLVGEKASTTQARQFPRVGTMIPGVDSVVPDAVKWAQVAEACAMLSTPGQASQAADGGLTSFSIGPKSATVDLDVAMRLANRPISRSAEAILRTYGLTQTPSGAAASITVPRG